MKMRHTLITAALLGLLTPLVACDALQAGTEDKLAFEFVATDRLIPVSFSTPLAAGFSVDVAVYVANTARTPATVTLVRSTNQDVARTSDHNNNRFTIRGRVAGSTTIEAVSPSGNDSFPLSVADVATVDLAYPGHLLGPATPPVRVAQGGTARFGMTLKDAGGRLLIGYGAAPVALSPEAAATEVATTSTGHFTVRFDALGVVTLTPAGSSPLEVTVIAVEAIDSMALTIGGDVELIEVGATAAAIVDARDEENLRVLGLTGVVEVMTSTPSVCQVTQSPVLGDAAYEILGLTPGVCALTATLGAHTADATVEVE